MKPFLILLFSAMLQSAPSAKGVWEGTVSLPGQELTFSTTLIQNADAWTGTFDIQMQGAKGVPVGTLTVAGAAVSFTIPGPGQPIFKLIVSTDGKSLTGTLTQSGASFPVKLAWKGDAKPVAAPEIVDGGQLEGIWQGSVPVGGQQIRLVVRFAKSASGSMNGFFSSPDQGPGRFRWAILASRTRSLSSLFPRSAQPTPER